MSEETFGLMQEPKKMFISFLILNLKEIEAQIFFSGRASKAIRGLRGLIGSLSKEAKKSLKEEYGKLREWDRTGNCTRQDVEDVYDVVCSYLHKTYLKEVGFARPARPSKGFPGVPDS